MCYVIQDRLLGLRFTSESFLIKSVENAFLPNSEIKGLTRRDNDCVSLGIAVIETRRMKYRPVYIVQCTY